MKSRPDPIRCVGLVANTEKPHSREFICRAADLLREHGLDLAGDRATVAMSGLRIPRQRDAAALARCCDLLLVFGGDGTILRVAREIAGGCTPLLGIHVGRLGFLAEVTTDQIAPAIEAIATGRFRIEPRALMQAKFGRRAPIRALNDFVFSRGDVSRMIELDVAVDGEALTTYRCDGLIVSTPTGSTAYSLAAGGAIVSPTTRVFTLTPICPLTLSNRSVIVDMDCTIAVRVRTERLPTHLTADGQVAFQLRLGDEVIISRAREEVRLLRLHGSSFFNTLRQKLHWSGSHP